MLATAMVILGLVAATQAISCEDARMRCAYRSGCGRALQGYVMACSAILHEGPPDQCPEQCQHSLIALMSSDEGKDLMTCECADDVCRETKERVEVCRPHVMKAVRNETVVSCVIAQWICAADSDCSTALEYYHKYCKSMFLGRKCSYRCKNSISILRKQEKAAKLDSCRCDGSEEYDCPRIRTNMARLCFNKEPDINQLIPPPKTPPEEAPKQRNHNVHRPKPQDEDTEDNNSYDNNIERIIGLQRNRAVWSTPSAAMAFLLCLILLS